MRPVHQFNSCDPSGDLWASTLRAAVASVLRLDVADVPQFVDGDTDDMTQLDAFLKPRGLCAIEMPRARPWLIA
jgi:hypothetical protein